MGDAIAELDTKRLENFLDRYLELDRRAEQPYGVFSFLSGQREKKYQQTLKYFLDPNKPHGFGVSLLEIFLEIVGAPEFNLAVQHVEVAEEVYIGDDSSDSRIDLVICGGQALNAHPDWGVFLELKVGADENVNQTPTYAAADSWQFPWFDTTEITVDDFDATYVYVKKAAADPPQHDDFDPVNWATIADVFDNRLQGSLFQYPNRSVVQLTDFIQSLQETENMDSPLEEDELTERLKLYFEYEDVIHQVEQAKRDFESDFDDLSSYLTDQWAEPIRERFDVAGSGWMIRAIANPKWQGLMPEYWDQDPKGGNSTIALFFQIPPTIEHLRNQELSFRLRLPPQRNVHNRSFEGDRSFNAAFTERCLGDEGKEIRTELKNMNVTEIKLGTASTLFVKNYDLDPEHLVSSYFEQVTTAVDEFCSKNPQLLADINSVFENSYEEAFDEPPAGEFPGALSKRSWPTEDSLR